MAVISFAAVFLMHKHISDHPVSNKNSGDNTVSIGNIPPIPVTVQDMTKGAEKPSTNISKGFTPNGVPVLMYHRVGDLPENADATTTDLTVSTANFEEQMTFLDKQGYVSITPDQLYGWLSKGQEIPKKSVIITFDDGYQDVFDNAVPILLEHHFVGVFGIITGFVGTRDYASWQTIGAAKAKGMIIVSHSFSHFDFSKHNYTDQEYSIAKSTMDINDNLGFTPTYFIYPYGTYNTDTENILTAHGYVMALTTAYGFAQKGENLLEIPRIRVHGKEVLPRFEYDVAGIPLPVDQTAENKNPDLLQMPTTATKGE